ncbi:MAG: hypothetical protein RLZZ546_936 [Bacteroidota bacterium]|jgi:hypothetical protein
MIALSLKTKKRNFFEADLSAIIYYTWCGMFNLIGGRACPIFFILLSCFGFDLKSEVSSCNYNVSSAISQFDKNGDIRYFGIYPLNGGSRILNQLFYKQKIELYIYNLQINKNVQ